jgi:chromosome segregation ATPase
LNDEKLKLEYEFRQRNESTSKQLNELRVEFENLQQNFSDKVVQNKKLYSELNSLEKALNVKVEEIQGLRAQLNECMDRNARLNDEKIELEEIVNNLKEIKHRNQNELEDLFHENERLKKSNFDQDKRLKKLDADKEKLLINIDNLNYENSNLITKIKGREENLHSNQRILEETKQKNMQYIVISILHRKTSRT